MLESFVTNGLLHLCTTIVEKSAHVCGPTTKRVGYVAITSDLTKLATVKCIKVYISYVSRVQTEEVA